MGNIYFIEQMQTKYFVGISSGNDWGGTSQIGGGTTKCQYALIPAHQYRAHDRIFNISDNRIELNERLENCVRYTRACAVAPYQKLTCALPSTSDTIIFVFNSIYKAYNQSQKTAHHERPVYFVCPLRQFSWVGASKSNWLRSIQE